MPAPDAYNGHAHSRIRLLPKGCRAKHHRNHRRPHVPHRSLADLQHSLACAPGPRARGAERDDALLRCDSREGGATARPMAGGCAAQRQRVSASRPATGGVRKAAYALLVTAALASSTPSRADRLPRVRVVATGRTIATRATGRRSANELVGRVAHADRLARVEAETFTNLPSAVLTLDDCARLSRHLVALFAADRELDGVVVTSGTDMLEELAWFLYLTVADDRPVVVVGAMRRPGAADDDGPGNLADAVRVAAARSTRGLGTIVVMHGQILSARDARKRHATSLDAFDAPASERLGVVKGGTVNLAVATL